jgi:hypothetical protein
MLSRLYGRLQFEEVAMCYSSFNNMFATKMKHIMYNVQY